ncbi:MAG TPA: dephospho-CoA kinase [Myxococcota bacterium]|nr:dephospho-CoA kinase [Myxococcota bacterium]
MSVTIGLSGGIGTGKSSVARMFAAQGAVVIDADAIVHELQARGTPMVAELAEAFGPGVLDAQGGLDRAALGAIVFRDPDARARLNAIVHPKVGAEFARRIAAARASDARVLVLDIPLLFEGRRSGTGSAAKMQFDATVLVYAPEALQIERQVSRDACSRDEAIRRVRAQMPIEEKKALADYVIDNGGSLAETERQVREVLSRILAAAP